MDRTSDVTGNQCLRAQKSRSGEPLRETFVNGQEDLPGRATFATAGKVLD